jgi:TPR repeat protein
MRSVHRLTGLADFERKSVASDSSISALPETPELRHRKALDAYEAKDYPSALKMALALVDEDFYHANALAGVIYEEGGNGVEQDLEKARFYFERATETVGSLEGWLALGRIYFFGKGVPKDYSKALSIYRIVEEDSDNAIGQLMLGRMYRDGLGVPRDFAKAKEHLCRAADKGNVIAVSELGIVERAQGNLWGGFRFWLRSRLLAFAIMRRDPTDSRLRSS